MLGDWVIFVLALLLVPVLLLEETSTDPVVVGHHCRGTGDLIDDRRDGPGTSVALAASLAGRR